MQTLLIEQKSPSGLLKTWRIRSEQKLLTFGNSKHADMRSPLDSIKGIQGIFEFRGGKWYYINLDMHSIHLSMPQGVELCLDKKLDLNMGVSTLSITPLEARATLFSKFDTKTEGGKQPYQLYTVYQGSQLVETEVVPMNKKFISRYDRTKTALTPVQSNDWKKSKLNDLDISEKTVYLSNVEALKKAKLGTQMDDTGKKSVIATGIGTMLLLALFLMAPKKNQLDEILTPLPPKTVEMKLETPKKKKAAAQKPAEQVKQAAAPTNNQGGGSKAASAIKSLASGRITQLIGKISASAARSNNVVVTSGVAAGSRPTGRALAALGSISKSGKDWTAEGKGSGITISTKGKAGGVGVSGMGSLNAGNTGAGGAELLEDEGEIVGGLDREIIAQYIKSQLGQILYCYERQLSANPELYGKVAVKFTIGGDGGVETQRIGDTTLRNATVEGCILQRVARWKFPAPEGGTKVLVTYPFLFKSTN